MERVRPVLPAAAAVLAALAVATPALGQTPQGAVAQLVKPEGTSAGQVELVGFEGGVAVLALVSGLPPGFHGFHVHTTGSCVGPSFTSAGGHLNPTGAVHPAHAGDLPPLYVKSDGRAIGGVVTDRFTIAQLFDTDGSAIIVHADPDNQANIPADRYDPDPDATTLATGDAGGRIACGVISAGEPRDYEVGPPAARADLRDSFGSAAGFVHLRQEAGNVVVLAFLEELPVGFHGFHVHETGSCVAPSFTSAGGHLNPLGASHPGHAGDMPTAFVASEGFGVGLFETDRFRLAELFDADGSAFVVHASPDNFGNIPTDRYDPDPDATTLATGDAGARIACGVVRRIVRCTVTVAPRALRAGRRTVLRMRVRSGGIPVQEASVRVRGAGVSHFTGTDTEGVARTSLRPRRAGRLSVTVPRTDTTLGCRASVRVLPARRAVDLTGRPSSR